MAGRPEPWVLVVGGVRVDRARTLKLLQGPKRSRFWIRNRRGRTIEAWNESTGECWRYFSRGGWIRRIEGRKRETRHGEAKSGGAGIGEMADLFGKKHENE